ncbi:MAG: GNAT family N-acetyltransferase [Chitinophagales bacterium]|nr:GNAT family N-acetyltransferase [Chitinophagales bacterium]
MDKFEFKIIPFDSPDYWNLVRLREIILRLPLFKRFVWGDLMQEKEELIMGLFDGDKIIGCMQFMIKGHTYKMRQVAIKQTYQSKGVGTQLLQHAEAHIKTLGGEKIYCHARDTAVNFYKKNGYAIQGEMFYEVGIEHYLMEKILSN